MTQDLSRESPYAPMALRDEPWWRVGRRAAQRGDVGPDGTAYDPGIQDDAMRVLNAPNLADLLVSEAPTKEARDVHEQWAAVQDLPTVVGQYELHGRQIFDFSSGLVQMLQHTDIRDCSVQNLLLPYPALYMHFGRAAGIEVEGSNGELEYIDGALIAHAKDESMEVLKLALSGVDRSGARVRRTMHYTSLPAEAMRLPVQQAIDAGVEYFLDGPPRRSDVPEWVQDFWEDRRRHAGKAAIAALPLIVNGLFYLENPPRPHRVALGAATPAELVAQWEGTVPARRRKLQAKLTADGYTLVHLVGEEIAHRADGSGSGTVAPHWRRGHWREQAHGPKMSLRKRILIKPVLVNGHGEAHPLDVPGHVYKTGKGDGQGASS
jgi:hypothetical protein